MTIEELIRQRTLCVRDAISDLERQLDQTQAEYKAADARVKRCGTEVTQHRQSENEHKKSFNNAAEKVAEAQRILDELECKRQDALGELWRLQEEQNQVDRQYRAAQSSTQDALAEIRKERKVGQDAEKHIKSVQKKLEEKKDALRQAMLEALEVHLKSQSEQVYSAFNTQEEHTEANRAFEEFKKARHTDPDISRLCEEREELEKLLKTAIVPKVREMLQTSLKDIREQIESRFPGALNPRQPPVDNPIDDLLFYCNKEGKAVFLLPIDPAAWHSASRDAQGENESRAMCITWHFLRDLKLKVEDGQFIEVRGRPAYQSQFGIEDVAILHGFGVKSHESEVMRFVLSAVPPELQEALVDENTNL